MVWRGGDNRKNDSLLFWRVTNVVGCTTRRVERWMNGTVLSFMSYVMLLLDYSLALCYYLGGLV